MPTQRLSVVVTRRLPEIVETRMKELFDVELRDPDTRMTREDLADAVKRCDVLVPCVTDQIDAALLAQAGPRLKLIANYGAGVDHIDLAAARARFGRYLSVQLGAGAPPPVADVLRLWPAKRSEDEHGELVQGLGWGEAKNRLFQLLDNELGESRERYHQLIERPADLEDILQIGAKKARAVATPFLNELREAVGLRSFVNQVQVAATTKKKAAKAARFVSFREDDGSFRFRLLAADGEQLLLSRSFADGKSAGAVSKQLQQGGEADVRVEGLSFGLWLNGEQVADGPQFDSAEARDAAVQSLHEALTPQQD